MQFNSLNDWLGWLEQCHPQEIELGLERSRKVAERLQLLKPSARVVTVAGTNGKGSCVTATAALLRSVGLRVGVYTSPHLLHYCERICVDAAAVSEQEVCDAFAVINAARESISLTYFEFGTLAALEIFRHRQVDVMVLEVGLGGRLDAVNIVDADIAVITSIDLDHQDWLGSDRETIGREKAGIMRVSKPVVCADPVPPESLLTMARTLAVEWHGVGREFGFTETPEHWSWWSRGVENQRIEYKEMPLPRLPLPSLAAALEVTRLLSIDLSHLSVAAILADLRLPGRFQQVVYRDRQFILDVAHNPAATEYFARRLQQYPCKGRTFAVVAMMADKDRLNSLGNLTHIIDSWYLADLSWLPRAATPAQLEQDLRQLTLPVTGVGSVAKCIALTIDAAQPEDRILIFGSFFTVAAALAVLQDTGIEPGGSR